jgi:hypothetical protein
VLTRAASTVRRRWPFLLIGALTLSSVLFSGLWLGAASARSSQANASFSGVKMNKFDAVDGGGSGCAPAANWGDIPGATQTFKLGGTANRPVLVTVSLQAVLIAQGSSGYVRLLIDDGQQGVGPLTWHVAGPGGGSANDTLGYTFLTLALAPGSHTAKVQFNGSLSNSFCLDHWTMAILHV